MYLQLPTGNTVSISTEFFFSLKDEEITLLYQSCIADNLGIPIENPFAHKSLGGDLEAEDPEPEE